MKYNKEPLQLNSPVSFWMNFPNEERVFWVDRQSDRIVVGAKRLATVKDDDDRHNYAYVFYGDTFFDTVKDPKWSNMGHEMIAFTHYYIVENGESFYLHAGESVPIENYEVPRVHHHYKETSNDKADWNRLMNAIADGISSGEMTAYDKENGILSILMYNYVEPDMDKKDSENVEITISGISSESVCERTFSICDEGGSAYEWWQKLGQPDFVNESILHKLNEKSKMVEDSKIIRREKENDYLIKTELRKGDVQLIQLHI